jgi:hypothetical protein
MYKNYLFLRNVAVAVACLAAMTVFSGCDPENDPDNPSDADNSNYFYSEDPSKEITALRNVKMKWRLSWDVRDMNDTYRHTGQSDGEFMACAGRSLLKSDGDMEGNWSHYWISKLEDPTTFYFYSLNKHEYFIYEWGNPGDAIDASYAWKLDVYNIFTFRDDDVEYTFRDDKKIFMTNGVWNAPVTETFGSITVTAWCETIADRQIAGINCKGYIFNNREVNSSTGIEYNTHYTVYYDPATDLTMYYEEDFDKAINLGGEHHNKKFEVTEIEYGKTVKANIDAVLNEYLRTNNPKDVSDTGAAGW